MDEIVPKIEVKADVKITVDATKITNRLTLTLEKAFGATFKPLSTWINSIADNNAKVRSKKTEIKIQQLQNVFVRNELTANQPVSYAKEDSLIQERTNARIDFIEAKKQLNFEQVLIRTANEFKPDEIVSSDDIDEDWMNRFFEFSSNISNEQMHKLWAKILADELRKPGAFSLKALDVLKNMTTKEAELFTKVASLSLFSSSCRFLPNDGRYRRYFTQKHEIGTPQVVELMDLGLLSVTNLNVTISVKPESSGFLIGIISNHISYYNNTSKDILIEFPATIFTKVGQEISELVNKVNYFDPEYIGLIKGTLEPQGLKVDFYENYQMIDTEKGPLVVSAKFSAKIKDSETGQWRDI